MSGKKRNIIDRRFGEALKNYHATPPEEVWTGISGRMDIDRKKARMIWIRRVAAAVALVLAAGTSLFLLNRSPETGITRTEQQQESAQTGKIEVQPGMSDQIPEQTDISIDVRTLLSESEESGKSGPELKELPESEEVILTESVRAGTQTREQSLTANTDIPETGSGWWQAEDDTPQEGEFLRVKGIRAMVNSGRQAPSLIIARADYKRAIDEEPGGIDVFREFGEDVKEDFSRWGVGGQVTPLYSYRNIEASDQFNSTMAGYYNGFENGILSYAGGVNIQFSPAKRLSLQSGLYYSRMGVSINNTYIAAYSESTFRNSMASSVSLSNSVGRIVAGPEKANAVIITNVGSQEFLNTDNTGGIYTRPDGVQHGEILQHFEYIELPLILRYRLVDRKLGMNLLGGVSTNFLVGSNVYFQEEGSREFLGKTENLETVNYSSVLGLGLQYSVTRNLLINMEPTFRYYLNSVNSGSRINSHPYSLGFFTGISYLF